MSHSTLYKQCKTGNEYRDVSVMFGWHYYQEPQTILWTKQPKTTIFETYYKWHPKTIIVSSLDGNYNGTVGSNQYLWTFSPICLQVQISLRTYITTMNRFILITHVQINNMFKYAIFDKSHASMLKLGLWYGGLYIEHAFITFGNIYRIINGFHFLFHQELDHLSDYLVKIWIKC